MKQLIFAILFCTCSVGYCQSFEGKLTYSIDYRLDSNAMYSSGLKSLLEENNLYRPNNYNDSVHFFMTKNSYVRGGYKKENEKFIFKSNENILYRFLSYKKSRYQRVELIDVTKRYETCETTLGYRIIPIVQKSDSIRTINGVLCSLLILDFGEMYGREEYWYNSDTLKIDSLTFKNHNYEYWNKILEVTSSFPIEMVKITDNWGRLRITLTTTKELQLSDEIFYIPHLEPLKDEDSIEFMKSINRHYMRFNVKANKKL